MMKCHTKYLGFATIILVIDKKMLKIGHLKHYHDKNENLQWNQVGHNFGSGHDGGVEAAYRFCLS